jgi:signal transduction histidine kinase/CheY-like chemotaxis protein
MMRVLIADDKEENLCYLQALLAGHGCAVDTARDGAEALVMARQSPPELMISDLLMPVMDGYTLLRHWKADPRLKHIPFVVYTATYTEPQDEQLALHLGADAFILKGTEPEPFMARIRAVLAAQQVGAPAAPKQPVGEEKALLKEYSEVLVHKLEEKACQLAETNRALEADIAQRKRTEDELRWRTAFFEAQVDSALDGILVVDSQGRKILQNRRVLELWKIPPHIAKNEDDASQVKFITDKTKNPKQFMEEVARLYSHPEEVSQDEIELVDGTVLERYSSPVRDRAGKHYGRIWTFRDITERRRLEAQFIEAQKMEVIGRLAGGVAHDFNNILAVIMGYIDLTINELDSDQKTKSNLETIRVAAEHAAGLTRQLLIFSRKQTVQPVVLDLNDVVNQLDKMLRRLINENIEMTIFPGKQTGRVRADSGYVGQVLMNLVVNARDAMPNGGKLTIATGNVTLDENYARTHAGVLPGEYVMFSVSDTGTGMPDAVKAHLFEAFFTTKPQGKGTGLGLATCQTIVRQSGGHIGVYTEPGKGTTFKVYLPRVDQLPDVTAGATQTRPWPRGTETLLVVEDDPAVRFLAHQVLEAQGYEVLRACNGEEALHLAREHQGAPIRLVISDVIMPLMGGKVMAQWLRTSYPNLKILFTSGYTDDAVVLHGVMERGVEFLPKPYTSATLVHKVREMLDSASETAPL